MRMLAAAFALLPAAAFADTHALGIRNGSTDTVTGVYMSAPGSGTPGANRLLSRLPPGAEGTFTYSAGCRADVRIAYAGGRSEDHANADVCGGNKLVAGQDGTEGPAMPATAKAADRKPANGKTVTTTAAAPPTINKAPPPVVPPWTGKSITKRFGGME